MTHDEELQLSVMNALHADPLIDPCHIGVTVNEKVVTLTGGGSWVLPKVTG